MIILYPLDVIKPHCLFIVAGIFGTYDIYKNYLEQLQNEGYFVAFTSLYGYDNNIEYNITNQTQLDYLKNNIIKFKSKIKDKISDIKIVGIGHSYGGLSLLQVNYLCDGLLDKVIVLNSPLIHRIELKKLVKKDPKDSLLFKAKPQTVSKILNYTRRYKWAAIIAVFLIKLFTPYYRNVEIAEVIKTLNVGTVYKYGRLMFKANYTNRKYYKNNVNIIYSSGDTYGNSDFNVIKFKGYNMNSVNIFDAQYHTPFSDNKMTQEMHKAIVGLLD